MPKGKNNSEFNEIFINAQAQRHKNHPTTKHKQIDRS